ncbi:MAG: YgjV family protein [Clostridia bacterium]|nr:YgjV family protein [Clostridia bacterium]
MWADVLIQAIGFIGIALNIIAVQFNKHWQIILFKTLGSALFVLQYILLEAWTGAAMDGIGILRNVIFIFTVKNGKPTFFWVIFFSVLTVILGAATFEGWVSFLAIGAKLLSCIAYGIDNPRTIRYLGLPTSMLWITYNSIHVSIAGVINELLVTASIIIAEIRFIEAVKKNKNKIKAKGEQDNGIQSISERT